MLAKFEKADELSRLALGAEFIKKLNLITRAARSIRPQAALHPRSIRG